jgi:hypothetical protein
MKDREPIHCTADAWTTLPPPMGAGDKKRLSDAAQLLCSKHSNAMKDLAFVIQVKCDRDFTQDLGGYHWILTDKSRGETKDKDIKKMRIVAMDGESPKYASEMSWDGPVELLLKAH